MVWYQIMQFVIYSFYTFLKKNLNRKGAKSAKDWRMLKIIESHFTWLFYLFFKPEISYLCDPNFASFAPLR
jgi:hypothetical protein